MLVGFFIFGFVGIFVFEYMCTDESKLSDKNKIVLHYSEKVMSNDMPYSNSTRRQSLANLTQFFDIVLPLEFTQRSWYKNFWIEMLEKHSYIAFLAPAEGQEKLHC